MPRRQSDRSDDTTSPFSFLTTAPVVNPTKYHPLLVLLCSNLYCSCFVRLLLSYSFRSPNPLMSVEEVSSTPIDFPYESASNIVMTEGTQTTEGTNAAQSTVDPNQNANTDTTVAENQGYQPKKRPKTSHVWKSFKEVKVGTKRKAECIYCKHHFAILKCGVTSHLKRHIEEACPRRPANQADKNQQRLSLATIHENSESVTAVENFRYDQTKVREAISHWMIVCEKAICTADHIMFTNMMKAASPFYQRVTRANSTADLFTTYESFKKKLKQDLKHVQRMSVTTDLWKSSVQTLQYMVVTGHFVDKKGELQKCILNFCGLEPPHAGIGVSDALYKCLVD
ncbi:Zinc finger BED domain-containing protein RICESLEEPER 2 [Linum grandiflorum]